MVVVALALAFCAVVLGDEPTSHAAPPTHAEALAILRPPAGSLSVGTPANGRLERAVRVPLRGRSYRFLPRVVELHRLWKVFWRTMSERFGREEPVRQQRLGLERA